MQNLKVLLVEDLDMLRDLLDRYLSAIEGIEIVTAASIKDAREVISRSEFDIVISDLELEKAITGFEKTGVDLLREVREKNPNMPLWLMSANPNKVPKENIAWNYFFSKGGDFHRELKDMLENVITSKKILAS